MGRPGHSHPGTQKDGSTLIADVTLHKTDTIAVHVRFRGGTTTSLTLPIPLNAWQARATPPAVVAAIDELLDSHTHAEIADILNARGLTSGANRPFHRLVVRNIRDDYQLRSREQRLKDAGMLTRHELAEQLGVTPKTINEWHHAGLVTGHAFNDKNERLFEPPDPNPPRKQQGAKLANRRRSTTSYQPAPGGAV